MNTQDIQGTLQLSDEWLALGIVTPTTLNEMYQKYRSGEDPRPEHYRYGAFQNFLKARSPLGEGILRAIYKLGESDPDPNTGGVMMADILRLEECPLDLLQAALLSERRHIQKIAQDRLSGLNSGHPECYTCRSITGERRISPGPPIHEGKHWLVEHAYPCGMVGWLVVVLKRHVEALHDVTAQEFAELGRLQGKVTKALHRELGSEKEYLACFAEAEHFRHVHVHVVPKLPGLPRDLWATGVFKLLKVPEQEAVSPAEVRELCERLRRSL